MHHRYGLFLFILILILPCFVYSAPAKVITSNDIFTATLAKNSRCAGAVGLMVDAPSLKYFSPDSSELEQFVKMVRNKLNEECGRVSSMKVWGVVNQARVYEATTNASRGWKLFPAYPGRFEKYIPQINIKSKASRAPRLGLFSGIPWDRANKRSAVRGEYGVTISKNMHVKAQPGEFQLMTSSRRRNGPGTTFRFGGNLYAVCSQLMEIKGFAYASLLDFDQYRKTRKGYDLPAELIDGYYLMRDVLLEYCPELKVLRVTFETQGRDKTVNYTGTMTADSGWDLFDGTIKTAYDSTREVKIKGRDINRPTGIDYTGTCEPSPILPLKPIYQNKTDEAWSKPLTMVDYKYFARNIVKTYAKECPDVKDIRFSCTPIPQSYICVDDDNPCYLTWSPDDPETIDSSQMKLKPMLNDYNEVIQAFARADKKLLDEYEAFVRIFHNDWLEVYSDNYQSSIKNPRTFTLKTIETRYDQEGFEESSRQLGPIQTVYVESYYADRFESFFRPNHAWGTVFLMKRIINNGSGSRGTMRGVQYLINNRKQLDEFMSGGRVQAVQIIYENLDRYYSNKPMKKIALDKHLNPMGSDVRKKTPPPKIAAPVKENPGVGFFNTSAPKSSGKAVQPKRVVNPETSYNEKFPADLVLSPAVNDFLLARYYPNQLSQRMLEAMLSSRWSYERSAQHPVGGRFFRIGHRPVQKDMKKLTNNFRQWLVSGAKKLPQELILDVPLQYGNNTVMVQNNCFTLIQPENAPVRMSQAQKNQAARSVQQCEVKNSRITQQFNACNKRWDALEQAEQKLARLQADGCVQKANDPEEAKPGEGPCNFPSGMSIADMQNEMRNCLANECGTYTAGTDIQAYQDCVRRVTQQLQAVVRSSMGQSQPKRNNAQQDPCRAAKQEIKRIKQQIKQSRCDAMGQEPALADCASLGVTNEPETMQVERIEWSHIQYCSKLSDFFNRNLKASAELLPGKQPYRDTQYGFALSIDKLDLPYDIHVPGKKSWGIVNARVKVALMPVGPQVNTPGRFGLKGQMKGIDFKKVRRSV